jgi:hypothetical protein
LYRPSERVSLVAGDAADKLLRVFAGDLELGIDQPSPVHIDASR